MKKTLKFITLLTIMVLLVVAMTGCTSTETGSKTTLTTGEGNNSTNSSMTNSGDNKKYSVGEIYEDKNIAIKYVKVDDNFKGYNQYADVKSGCKIVKADFEFENVGNSDAYVSAYEFNCYADGYDCESFYFADDSGFSSTLSKGKKAKGSVYFQVPTSATSVIIEYELNVWTNNKVEFVVK